MWNPEFFGTFDVTALVLTVFTLFFFGLIIYLRREDRREGYPIEDDITGKPEPAFGLFFAAQPKAFHFADGRADVLKPDGLHDDWELNAARRPVSGTPLQPVGDPMLAGVGPGAYARRSTLPDRTAHGELKVAPMRDSPGFFIPGHDPDPRGYAVRGVDGAVAGVVADVWIDRGEIMIRYLEVELAGPATAQGLSVVGAVTSGRRVVLPLTMAVINRGKATVTTDAITAAQFADVPRLANPDEMTRDEEERVCAYYGAGYLYATPARSEPLL